MTEEREHWLDSPLVSKIPYLGMVCGYMYVSVNSAYAEYFLMEPSEMYAPIMATVHEKIYLSKVSCVMMSTSGHVTVM